MTLFAVPNLLLQWGQQIECDIRRLKVLRIRVGYIVRQRSKGRSSRSRSHLTPQSHRGSVHARNQSSRNRFHIAFDAANLPGEEYPRMRFHLQGLAQQSGRVDVRVAVDLPVAQNAGILQSWNQAQYPRLL